LFTDVLLIQQAGYTYTRFARALRNSAAYFRAGINAPLLASLTGRGMEWNRHFRACPFAVVKALQIHVLEQTRLAPLCHHFLNNSDGLIN